MRPRRRCALLYSTGTHLDNISRVGVYPQLGRRSSRYSQSHSLTGEADRITSQRNCGGAAGDSSLLTSFPAGAPRRQCRKKKHLHQQRWSSHSQHLRIHGSSSSLARQRRRHAGQGGGSPALSNSHLIISYSVTLQVHRLASELGHHGLQVGCNCTQNKAPPGLGYSHVCVELATELVLIVIAHVAFNLVAAPLHRG